VLKATFLFSQTFEVKSNGALISNGDTTPDISDNTDFGSFCVSSTKESFFRIKVAGEAIRDVVITISSSNTGEWSLSESTYNIINAGDFEKPRITFNPSTPGLKTAIVTITSKSVAGVDEDPYVFHIQGNAFELPPEIKVFGETKNIYDESLNSPSLVNNTDFGARHYLTPITKVYTIKKHRLFAFKCNFSNEQ
jgi:hypothetical protein